MARTLILKWNPAISSYTKERFEEDLADHFFFDFNWSVWEHQQVQPGDRFFLIRVMPNESILILSVLHFRALRFFRFLEKRTK